MKNTIITGAIALIVGLVIGYVLSSTSVHLGAVSTSGTYNNDVGISQITFTPSTSTSTSILNSGASDRAVIGSYGMCTSIGTSTTLTTGTGLANWTLQSATTSGSSLGVQGSTNFIFNTTIATTSNTAAANATGNGIYYASSTAARNIGSYIWPVNTYLTFDFNATNTASCSLGVTWLPL